MVFELLTAAAAYLGMLLGVVGTVLNILIERERADRIRWEDEIAQRNSRVSYEDMSGGDGSSGMNR